MESGNEIGISGIGQIAITAYDLERATAFYRDTLGLKHLFSVEQLSFFDCAGIRLMLARPETPELDHPASVIYFRVADIQKSYELLLQRGVKFEEKPHLIARMPDHDLWLAAFRDSENNLMSLQCEIARR